MKQTLFLFAVLFYSFTGFAQETKADITKKIETSKKKNATVLIQEEKGKFKLYAVYGKESQLTELYAIDNNGKKVEPQYMKGKKKLDLVLGEGKFEDTVKCSACVTINGHTACYPIDCSKLPNGNIK